MISFKLGLDAVAATLLVFLEVSCHTECERSDNCCENYRDGDQQNDADYR